MSVKVSCVLQASFRTQCSFFMGRICPRDAWQYGLFLFLNSRHKKNCSIIHAGQVKRVSRLDLVVKITKFSMKSWNKRERLNEVKSQPWGCTSAYTFFNLLTVFILEITFTSLILQRYSQGPGKHLKTDSF